jgi:hypothetical protein
MAVAAMNTDRAAGVAAACFLPGIARGAGLVCQDQIVPSGTTTRPEPRRANPGRASRRVRDRDAWSIPR